MSVIRHPVAWLRERDRGFAALRRAGRTALIMPAMFALGDKVIDNPTIATFAAFGAFGMLLLVDFGGSMRDRLEAHVALAVAGAVLVSLGTLASREAWLAAIATAVVAFVVLFTGVVSSVLAGAAPSLLIAFVLSVSTRAPASAIPDRLAGWAIAAVAAFIAIAVLWPAPTRDPLRSQAALACRALAHRLRADVAYRLGTNGATGSAPSVDEHTEAVVQADAAVAALHRTFLVTPYRPTGLSTPARTVVRLVDELGWLNRVVVKTLPMHAHNMPPNPPAIAVKTAAATVLDQGADLLEHPAGDETELAASVTTMREALAVVERDATTELPVHRISPAIATSTQTASAVTTQDPITEIVSSLDPSFRAQELTFVTSQIAANIASTAAAERRSVLDRFLGRQPEGLPGTLTAAQQRAAAHFERHSVWLHNSVRGAVGLAAAVFVANVSGVQHSFWVVLGTLSVLRSNALNTGQNILRGLTGTTVGVAIGAILLHPVGTHTAVLWALLPVAILIAGVAPAAISFAAGQAGFTLTLVILFNRIAPTGWRVGLVRVEDIALGCAVSLVVGVLFWPRGATAALGVALAEAYVDSAQFLAAAVEFGVGRCDATLGQPLSSSAAAGGELQAAASARRLDDTLRSYLAERGAKPVPLAEMIGLVNGVAALRLTAAAVLDLWSPADAEDPGDRAAARRELLNEVAMLQEWYAQLAAALRGHGAVPAVLARDDAADGRLIDAVRRDLSSPDGRNSATAVRVIWTGDHLDAIRRLQSTLVEPARAARAA